MKPRSFFAVLLSVLLVLASENIWAGTPGTQKWAFETSGSVISSPAIGPDGTIYVGSGDSNLYAINPDGSLRWSFDTGVYGVLSSPAIGRDGTIYVGSDSKKVYAINPDGSQKWAFSTILEIGASPAIGSDGTIYVGSFSKFYAINPDGTKKWDVAIDFTCTDTSIASSAAIGSDGTIYVGSCGFDGHLYALNPDGTEKWAFSVGGQIQSSPGIGADGTIYVGSVNESASSPNNNIWAINPDGTQQWVFPTASGIHASPTIGADGAIYAGCLTGLYALNPNGTGRWGFPTGWYVVSSAAIGSDGTIYVTGWSDRLYAINPDGSQKWVFVPPDAYVGSISSPVIGVDGTIYVGLGNTLYAIYSNSNSLAESPWPMFRQNVFHTGTSNPIDGIGPIKNFEISIVASPQVSGTPFNVTLTAKDASDEAVTIFTGSLNLRGYIGSAMTYFADDFEDGNYEGWTNGSGSYTRLATNDTAAAGSYSFTLIGGSAQHRSGVSYIFDQPQAPEDITFYVRSNSTALSDGYFVVGPDGSCPIFFFMKSNGVMYANADTSFSYSANTWYKVQFFVDWAGEEFDLYVDDNPVSTGIAFRNSVSSLSAIYLYNYDNSQAWWDEIEFDVGSRIPVSITPTTTTGFTFGTWTGSITVLEAATDMYIIADDGRGHKGISNIFNVGLQTTDTDGDGLMDSWEQQIIEANTNDDIEDIYDVLPLDDFDLDGFSNLREYLSNSNPIDSENIPPCWADFVIDDVVDGKDLFITSREVGREDCSIADPCESDLDFDNDVDEMDLLFFSEDYGRIDCQ